MSNEAAEHPLILTLRRIDPVLQFLTKATGWTSVPLPTVQRTLPQGFFSDYNNNNNNSNTMLAHVNELSARGILLLHYQKEEHQETSGGAASTSRPTASSSSADPSEATTTTTTTTTSDEKEGLLWENPRWFLGFPSPSSSSSTTTTKEGTAHNKQGMGNMHGSTKRAAKRRLAALKRLLKQEQGRLDQNINDYRQQQQLPIVTAAAKIGDDHHIPSNKNEKLPNEQTTVIEGPFLQEEQTARDVVSHLLGFVDGRVDNEDQGGVVPTRILPRQLSYAGSNPAQDAVYEDLTAECMAQIPTSLLKAFQLHSSNVQRRRLYRHQAMAIEAAMRKEHCAVCTGTGSGKSLCFLLPSLAACYNTNSTALMLFPTKALAQDQLSKLQTLLSRFPDLAQKLVPATLDGDTPHATRSTIAQTANIILTNPDTLHAAILPSWKRHYQNMLARVRYIVIDEAHMYEGVFGAHVAMTLSRLQRICLVAAARHVSSGGATSSSSSSMETPVFLGASATLPWPEQHFRRLCPMAQTDAVQILTSRHHDGSPRSAKHFMLWNPPVLNVDGSSTGRVTFPPTKTESKTGPTERRVRGSSPSKQHLRATASMVVDVDQAGCGPNLRRRHAADETALLLVRAVSQGIRCIVFCKTRNLVEWVYERACAALQNDPQTQGLVDKIESYRGECFTRALQQLCDTTTRRRPNHVNGNSPAGGYSMLERRKIEQKLFQNQLLGVVGTNALELGVDIGGIDLTLHCGYPSSYASLLQQAGRAGRGSDRAGQPSLSIVVCFNSAAEQHMWRHPKTLLAKGVAAPNTIPLSTCLVQGHMLCASGEFPLMGSLPITSILCNREEGPTSRPRRILCDEYLFGGKDLYRESLEALQSSQSIVNESVAASGSEHSHVDVFRAHEVMRKAWKHVSIRSIEPINYAVVNLAHPGQAGRMDAIHDEDAVMDTLPYSRVFYHAHPGAIITHRGRKYKVVSMMRPPTFLTEKFSYRRSLSLAAFAKPTSDRYATRPLSKHFITVLKRLETVELRRCSVASEDPSTDGPTCTFAGCGAVSVKRTVTGYKKISLITRAELSRTELSLPPLEFDSFGVWFDAQAEELMPVLGEKYGPGVHALSHALMAVAPLLCPGVCRSDLNCDHSFVAPSLITLFDERAGGSGTCERLWKEFFRPGSLLDAAVTLLEECSSCGSVKGYDGGCPECLHDSNCLKFNMHLSRSAAIVIGKLMQKRMRQTKLYRRNETALAVAEDTPRDGGNRPKSTKAKNEDGTPRRNKRKRALRAAKEMRPARDRQFVVGRPSWPLDGDDFIGRQVHGD